MDEIRRQDRRLFFQELFSAGRVMGALIVSTMVWFLPAWHGFLDPGRLLLLAFILGIFTYNAYQVSVSKRFYSARFKDLWQQCEDRLGRFDDVLKKLRREQVADLQEVPATLERTAVAIYLALRRADLVAHEVQLSERGIMQPPKSGTSAPTTDAQATELYRIADKNIAEYRQQFSAVMVGVQRTEAQAAVYMTTVDSLRMKLLGYRLVGRRPEMASHDLLETLAETKLQLQAIDRALDELDLSHYPKMISVVPSEVEQRLGD